MIYACLLTIVLQGPSEAARTVEVESLPGAEASKGSAEDRTGDAPWGAGVAEEDKERARQAFRAGNDLFERSKYAEALGHYRSALKI